MHEVFDLPKLFDDVVRSLQPLYLLKGLTLTSEIEPAIHKYRLGNTIAIRQVITNLLRNAQKFTENGGARLTASAITDTEIEIRVADTGIGVPEGEPDTIFERIHQVSVGDTRQHGGNGLDLSITREMVEDMGGSIGVRSRLGEWSVFLITLRQPHAVA